MADTTKRIIDLQTTTELAADSYVMIDGAVTGTKKYLLKDMDDAIKGLANGSGLGTGAVSTNAIADAAVTNAKLGASSVATANLQNGAVTLDKIASGSEATSLTSGLMSSTDKAKLDQFVAASNYALKSEIAGAYIYRGSVPNESSLPTSGQKTGDVYNIVAASSYGQAGANVAWNGSSWDTLGETFEIGDGTVTTAKIANLGVTEAKLGNSAVTTDKIGAAAVTESKLATSAVTENKLAASAVTTNKINNLAVTTGKLASGAVTTEKVADGNVTTAKIGTEAVTTVKIADGNVTTVKIADANVTEAKLANGAVTTGKISDAAITSAKLGSGAVIETKINDGAVTTSKLATNAVTTAKITDGNVTEAKLASNSVATAKIKDSNVTTDKIADLNVTEGKLANSAVTTNKLNDSAVTTAKIADANVTTAKIADLNVTTGKLANGAVTTDKVADGAITRDKLNEEVTEELDFKADVDGYYTDMTVGAADNLTGRGDTTTASFLYRTAGGTADIETGQALAKSVKGNTLVWNQLYRKNVESATVRGITYTIDANGLITLNGTVTQTGYILGYVVPVTVGHKYLTCGHGGNFDGSKVTFELQVSGGVDLTNSGLILTVAAGTTQFAPAICLKNLGDTLTNVTFRPQLFDLTQMFGAGNEPSTVAEFEALFPESYYEYDAGSLLSVNLEGIETVGFNQWDEEWESGLFTAETGAKYPNSTYIRSKTPIPCFPSTTYSATKPTAPGFHTYYYDADMGFINHAGAIGANASQVQFTTPANARYMNFCIGGANAVTTYNHDIAINLSWSGRRNGEYEPFWSSQRLIDVATYFPDGMRSAGTVYDELTSTEAITRVGAVDLGTLTWETSPTSGGNTRMVSNGTAGLIKPPASNSRVGNIVCGKYAAVTANNTYSDVAGISVSQTGNGSLAIYDSTYTDAAAFKTAMSGVYAAFELATPTVTPIDPALNLSYRVDDFGTERVMVPEDERSAPPMLDIAYGLNVVDFVRRAPSEYMSHASFQQFCIALQTKLGIVITETWDDTSNRYEYSIADAPSSNEG